MLSSQPLIHGFKTQIRLVPQSLREGESLSSFVDHQAQLWGLGRSALALQVSFLPAIMSLGDLDACRSDKFLNDYAELCGTNAAELQAARVNHPAILASQRSRHAYCPLCMREDLIRGETPYFRLDWARMLLSHCPSHRCPLFRWRECTSEGLRKLPHAWLIGEQAPAGEIHWYRDDLEKAVDYWRGLLPRTTESHAIWESLIAFESRLYKIGVGSPWYRSRGNSVGMETDIMQLAVRLVRPLEGDPEKSLIKTAQPEFEDHDVMAFTLRRHRDRTFNPSWRELRGTLTSLSCRRAVLAVVAQSFATKPLARNERIGEAV